HVPARKIRAAAARNRSPPSAGPARGLFAAGATTPSGDRDGRHRMPPAPPHSRGGGGADCAVLGSVPSGIQYGSKSETGREKARDYTPASAATGSRSLHRRTAQVSGSKAEANHQPGVQRETGRTQSAQHT